MIDIENLTIEETDALIYQLLSHRASLAEDIPKYTVINNETKSVDYNTVVITPHTKDEQRILWEVYDILEDPITKKLFKEWLLEFSKNSCQDNCSIVGTPRCCSVCPSYPDCDEAINRCEHYGDSLVNIKCKRRNKYEGSK